MSSNPSQKSPKRASAVIDEDPILKPASLVSEQILEYMLATITTYAVAQCKHGENDTVQSEMVCAKLENMGYAVGYRWTERLGQHITWNATTAASDPASAVAAQQLEAVKFLAKDVWSEIFRKPIDKLQTNHRGVFVLKDMQMRWVQRFPADSEDARVAAIQLVAFPCGLIRGVLANLGIPAVVSCDFLNDGQNMAACSFHIKVK